MINQFRRKFILICISSLSAVLLLIIGCVNILNYHNINKKADALLDILAENSGAFPKAYFQDKMSKPKPENFGEPRKEPPLQQHMSPEAPFATRYFTVLIQAGGSIAAIDTGRIAAISTEEASQYAARLFAAGKTAGFYGQYKYRAVPVMDKTMYIFVDCSDALFTFRLFLAASILISIAAIFLVFVLLLFFSRGAVKPLAESYAKQKQFITNASHELKTPLTIIDANTEVLEMEYGESEWSRSIKNQVKRLAALTENLVLLTRMDEEKQVLQMTDFSLSDAVDDAAQPFIAVAAASGKRLALDIQPGLTCRGNETAIRQLVSLLLDNAMKYSNDGGEIALRLRAAGKNKEFTFYNTVTEIDRGNLDVLFERFYRADASRSSDVKGYGIGLSVAKAIAVAHRGKITARSDDGKSILFTFIL